MIPPFDESGFLPPGIYGATLDEIAARFGQPPELRRAQMESIRWIVDLAAQAGAERIVLNGSFVTDIIEPNDVDCVLLFLPNRRRSRSAVRSLRRGLPFLDISIVDQLEFDALVKFFAVDRVGARKGMVEVIEWT